MKEMSTLNFLTLTQPPRASRSSQLSIGSVRPSSQPRRRCQFPIHPWRTPIPGPISLSFSLHLYPPFPSNRMVRQLGCLSSDYAEIIVVRHGETAWNADRRIQVVTDPDLRERHLGDLQGLVYHELAKLKPQAHQAFLSRETCQEIPGGGESLDQLHRRCTSSLQRIGNKHKGERVVVATHGGVIRTLLKKGCPNGKSIGKVANTSIHIFHLYDDNKWAVKSSGDVSHLNQTDFLQSNFGGDEKSG
ncbi:phosphoglycerate mutase-like protein 4 isoform X2 [Pyrus x bretschneideri]|uniref:phosphoglycerate mutase-like protein 4 isoform X2 n=1 Tax=Pyrus x bretschneideri TaxID=225117 RepID=UPI00202FDA8E|nr:phosphoglycerate mutase-like protein 4 isoform X2 [Pyrus x bretschneideri]